MYNDNNYFLINNKSANWSEIQICLYGIHFNFFSCYVFDTWFRL